MALTQTQVSQLYVSVFGRASEGGGNTYWQTDQADMVSTADTMLGTDAAKEYFSTTLDDNQAFIEHIYNNTLGKTITDDPDGIAYWVAELAAGKSKGEVVTALINAAVDPGNAGAAQDQFNNKVLVSDYTADTIEEYTDLDTFTGLIKDVTDDAATVTAAKAAVNDAAPAATYTIAADMSTVGEGETVTFTVTASHASNADVALNYQISGVEVAGGTADPATDLGMVTGKVTIAAGATTGTFTLSPFDDATSEGFEGFKVSLLDSSFQTVATTGNLVIEDGAQTGQTYNLTVNQDNISGNTANDTINALAYLTSSGAATQLQNTLQNVDVIDGGTGTDTLNVTLAENVTVASTIKNVENINVRFADAAADMDLTNTTGITAIKVADSTTAGLVSNIGSIADLTVENQKQDVNFSNSTAATLALTLDTFGKSSTSQNTIDLGANDNAIPPNASTAPNVTTLNLSLNNANADINSTTADKFTTLNIDATGSNSLTLTDSADNLKTVSITGAGSVNLTSALSTGVGQAPLTKFDASGSTGAITVEIKNTGVATAISTGAGNDTIDVDTGITALTTVAAGEGNDTVYVGDQLANFKSVAGGEGTDIINITDALTWDKTSAALISGFETLDISGGDNNTSTYDVTLADFTSVQLDEAIGGSLKNNVTLDKVADTSTLNIMSKADTDNTDFTTGNTIKVTLADSAGTTANNTAESTTINVTINDGQKDNAADGNVIITNYDAKGVENVTINSVVGKTDGGSTGVKDSGYSTTFTNLTVADIETLTLTGTTDIKFTALTNANNTLTKVDASAATGDITLDASAITTQVAYTGSTGVDKYNATDGGSIYAGSGNDQITLVNDDVPGPSVIDEQSDTIIYKSASDVSFVDKDANGKIDNIAAEAIAGFTTAASAGSAQSDVIDLTTFAFSGYAKAAVNKGALAAAVDSGNFATSITDFFADAAGDRGVAFGTNAGSTYVFVDANSDGDWNIADDLAIELTGVTNFTATDIAF